MREIFQDIYKNNKWKNLESRSGSGSTLEYTKELREHFPKLTDEFNIKTILDAPCGDFNWMKELLPNCNIKQYTGGDIVPEIVENNTKEFQADNIKFINLDITKDLLPNADLMICRDCLFHFPLDSIKQFFQNFLRSDIKYILTSTHYNNNEFKNTNIKFGSFAKLDLFIDPFNFDKNVKYSINDWIDPHPKRRLVLFSKEQVCAASKNWV